MLFFNKPVCYFLTNFECKNLVINMEDILESYIIRIYRWGDNNPQSLVGVVEGVGAEGRMAFTNLEELWDILNFKNSKEGGEGRGNFGLGNFGKI